MEIEFNPSRIGRPTAPQSPANSRAAAVSLDSASLEQTDALKAAVNKIPDVRAEKVQAARAAVADSKFPPDEILRAVSSLIAQKMEIRS